MDNPLHTVPEADRFEQDLPADPVLGRAGTAGRATGAARAAPGTDRFEQAHPVTTLDEPWRSGDVGAEWDVPEADRIEQAATVSFDDEDRAPFADELSEGDQ